MSSTTQLVGTPPFGRYVLLMDPNISTLERAFALAASGRFYKLSDIRLQLHREGYNHEMVQGPALTKQLVEAMVQARNPRESYAVRRPDKSANNVTGDSARERPVRRKE